MFSIYINNIGLNPTGVIVWTDVTKCFVESAIYLVPGTDTVKRGLEIMIIFEKQSLDRMKKDAESRYPNECCGILLGRRSETGERIVEEVCPTANAAHDKQERQFRINPLTLFKVERYAEEIGMEVIGFYHSHPDCLAEASAEDEGFALPDCSYPILSVIHGAVCDIQCWALAEEGDYDKSMFRKETIQYQERGEIILCQ